MTTIAPPNGNPGIVPPWLQNPITILPMPDGWQEAPALPPVPVPAAKIKAVK